MSFRGEPARFLRDQGNLNTRDDRRGEDRALDHSQSSLLFRQDMNTSSHSTRAVGASMAYPNHSAPKINPRQPGMADLVHGSHPIIPSSRHYGPPLEISMHDPRIPFPLPAETSQYSPTGSRTFQGAFDQGYEIFRRGSNDTFQSGCGNWDPSAHFKEDASVDEQEPPSPVSQSGYSISLSKNPRSEDKRGPIIHHNQRKPSNRDEFDGPHQLLNPPSPRSLLAQERDLPHLPTNLDVQEQDEILSRVNDILSKCAFDFIAKYQFPVPLESDKRQVRTPSDREWTEWVYLLKRLATKRRIPARLLYNNQIKQFITILENSLEMRHAAKHQSRPLKDDRNVLQLISAGTQVAKILKDASAMELLDRLYLKTEILVQDRKEGLRRGLIR